MYLNFIFPTIVGIEPNFLDESENEYFLNQCYSLSNKISLQHNAWLSKEKSPLNSFHSYEMNKDSNFSNFFKKMDSLVNEFANLNEDSRQYLCSNAWFNIYDTQSYQEPHYHSMATYSVVYYAKVPENSGPIVFMNPVNDEMGIGSVSFLSKSFWDFIPFERTAIIFRSNISHYVLHGNNSEDRVSIAANYCPTPESYRKIIGLDD